MGSPVGPAAESVLKSKVEASAFDVFLCHNSHDKPAVRQLAQKLKDDGVLPWLDEWELRPGLPWQRALEEQIGKVQSAAVFVGAEGIGPWEHQDLDAFLRAFVDRGCPVIPVLLEGAPVEPELPLFLKGMTWVDFRVSEPDPMSRLLWGITGKNVGMGERLAPHPPGDSSRSMTPVPAPPPVKLGGALVGSWQIQITDQNGMTSFLTLQIYSNGSFLGQQPTPHGAGRQLKPSGHLPRGCRFAS